jgi:hypothetical protein
LTRKLYNWNGNVSQDKWVVEGVFMLCAWVPIYGLASLGDALIFNSMEFWTGKNPVEMSAVGQDSQMRLSRVVGSAGEQLLAEQFQHGTAAASLRIQRDGQRTIGVDEQGQVVFSAMTLPDGTIVVSDAHGQIVATHSVQELRQLAQATSSQ